MKRIMLIQFYIISTMFCSLLMSQKYSYSIHIYNNGKYVISGLYSSIDDIDYPILLSYGNFEIHQYTLFLTDEINKYKQSFIVHKDSIIGLDTYQFFKNKSIPKYDLDTPHSEVSNVEIEERRKINNKINKYKDKINFGIYQSLKTKMYLMESYKYVYYIGSDVISEGTFRQKDNELILTDDALKHSFYFFLKEDGTIVDNFLSNYSSLIGQKMEVTPIILKYVKNSSK